MQWDLRYKKGSPAIQANKGSLMVQGCDFQQPGTQIALAPAVSKAIVMGNIFTGKQTIDNQSKGNVQIGLNADDH